MNKVNQNKKTGTIQVNFTEDIDSRTLKVDIYNETANNTN